MKLSYTKMVKALQKLGSVSTSKYLHNTLFDNCEIKSSKWFGHFGTLDFMREPERKDAITYQQCVYTEFRVKNALITIEHTIWNGNLGDGSRTMKKCEFEFIFNKSSKELMNLLSDLIITEMKWNANLAYKKELEIAMNKRIDEIFSNMLTELN
jgi:hypothetical protein